MYFRFLILIYICVWNKLVQKHVRNFWIIRWNWFYFLESSSVNVEKIDDLITDSIQDTSVKTKWGNKWRHRLGRTVWRSDFIDRIDFRSLISELDFGVKNRENVKC